MKRILKVMFVILCTVVLFGCATNETEPNSDYRYTIYEKALESGYNGSYDEWLATIKGADGKDGREIELTIQDDKICWRYVGTDLWKEIYSVNDLIGPKGENGISIIKIEKTKTEGLVDTYTITYSNDTTTEFTVTNGIDGIDGIDGKPGTDGHTPDIKIGSNGNWFIDDVDTSIKAKAEDGNDGISIENIEKTKSDGIVDTYTIYFSNGKISEFVVTNGKDGEKGLQGLPGKDGHTPDIKIGLNGNWFIDGVDSNCKAKGEGTPGKSAYDIYKEHYPEYDKTEAEWIKDLVNGNLAEKKVFKVTLINDFRTTEYLYAYEGERIVVPHSFDYDYGYYYVKDHKFIGWYNGEDPWDFETDRITEDITLTAKYEKYIKVTYVTYSNYENNVVRFLEKGSNLEGYYNTNLNNGMEFVGWYTDPLAKEDSRVTVVPDHDVVLYPKYKCITPNSIRNIFDNFCFEKIVDLESTNLIQDDFLLPKNLSPFGYDAQIYLEASNDNLIIEDYNDDYFLCKPNGKDKINKLTLNVFFQYNYEYIYHSYNISVANNLSDSDRFNAVKNGTINGLVNLSGWIYSISKRSDFSDIIIFDKSKEGFIHVGCRIQYLDGSYENKVDTSIGSPIDFILDIGNDYLKKIKNNDSMGLLKEFPNPINITNELNQFDEVKLKKYKNKLVVIDNVDVCMDNYNNLELRYNNNIIINNSYYSSSISIEQLKEYVGHKISIVGILDKYYQGGIGMIFNPKHIIYNEIINEITGVLVSKNPSLTKIVLESEDNQLYEISLKPNLYVDMVEKHLFRIGNKLSVKYSSILDTNDAIIVEQPNKIKFISENNIVTEPNNITKELKQSIDTTYTLDQYLNKKIEINGLVYKNSNFQLEEKNVSFILNSNIIGGTGIIFDNSICTLKGKLSKKSDKYVISLLDENSLVFEFKPDITPTKIVLAPISPEIVQYFNPGDSMTDKLTTLSGINVVVVEGKPYMKEGLIRFYSNVILNIEVTNFQIIGLQINSELNGNNQPFNSLKNLTVNGINVSENGTVNIPEMTNKLTISHNKLVNNGHLRLQSIEIIMVTK